MASSTPVVVRRSARQTAPVDRFIPSPSRTTTRRRRILNPTSSPSSRPSETPASPSVLDTHGARPNDFTVAEYFAGLGLMSRWARLAVEKVGGRRFLAVQLVEKDDAANGILRRAFQGVRIVGDIAALEKLKPCRLALAGIPCKGTTSRRRVAGNPDAMENLDTSMVEHFLRALKDTKSKPHVMLLENVPGMLSAKHEGLNGGFMRWLIRNLKALGYAGEWKLFSSGDNAQSGDRIFIVCRMEGVTSVRGCLLSLGGDRAPKPRDGLGFSRVKVGDAPVQGRLACLTESSGSPCFVFRGDDGEYRCVEFGVDAVSDLYTFDREDIRGDATDGKVLKMLANACRPVGKAIVENVVECLLEEKTPAQAKPEGAVRHGGVGALPNAGYWPAAGDDIFAYEDASKKIPGPTIPTERSAPERTAAAFAAECLSSDPPRAEPMSRGQIIEYVERAAMHKTRRRQRTLARHLAALFLAAFPGGKIFHQGHPAVNVMTTKRMKGRVTFAYHRAEGSEGLPHMLCLDGLEPAPAFVCFRPGEREAVAFGVKKSGVELSVQGMPYPRGMAPTDIDTMFPEIDAEDGLGVSSDSESDSEPVSVSDPGESTIEETEMELDEIGERAATADARRGGEDVADALDASPGARRRARSPSPERASTRATRARAAVGRPEADESPDLARFGDRGAARRGGGGAFPEADDALDASPGTRRLARSPSPERASPPGGNESSSASSVRGVIPAPNLLPGGTHLHPDRGISAAGDPQWLTVIDGPVGGRTRAGFAAVRWEEEEVIVPRGDGAMGAGTQPTQSSRNQVGRGHERLQRIGLVDLESLHSKTSGEPKMVWEHIDLFNYQGTTSNLMHHLHETEQNRDKWDSTRSGRRPISRWLMCGRCAGQAAINWLLKGEPEEAQKKVDDFEKVCREFYPHRARRGGDEDEDD